MNLPVSPPVLPMLAKRVAEIPEGEGWIFEPKWDGFRALVFRDGDEVLIQSRDEKSLNRYFPELVETLRAALPQRCVLDGEIVLARGEELDFEMLQQRIHPAASRVKLLAQQIPASVVFFDLLCDGDRDLRTAPFRERRALLEARLAGVAPPVHLTPATTDRALAGDWFRRFEGAGLDGVVAKSADGAYESNKRVMLKVKHERECDCVVAGFRWHARDPQAVGSLLLGLYDDTGKLQHVGVARQLHRRQAKRADAAAGAVPRRRPRRPSLARLGQRRRARRPGPPRPRREEPLEPGQGSLVAAHPPRAGRRGRLRAHAGHPLPPHRPLPPLAPRPRPPHLHLRTAGSRPAPRAEGDFQISAKFHLRLRCLGTSRATRGWDRRRDRAFLGRGAAPRARGGG